MSELNIGLIGDFLFPLLSSKDNLVYDGAKISGDEFVESLIKYGSHRYSFYSFPYQQEFIKQEVNRLKKTNPLFEKVEAYGLNDLKGNINNLSVIHNQTFTHVNSINNFRAMFSKKNIPVTSISHSMSYHFTLERCLALVMGDAIKSYDSIICTSEQVKQNFKEIFNNIKLSTGIEKNLDDNYTNIPYGLSLENFKPRDKNELRKKFNLPLENKLLLYVGRLSPYNKADFLPFLLAFKEYLHKTSAKHLPILLIAGCDLIGYTELIKKFIRGLNIENNVKIIEKLPRKFLPLYYSLADIFVSPSDTVSETFGITLIEAMASGLPVVVSDWNGYKELVTNGQEGFKASTYWLEQDPNMIELTYSLSDNLSHFYAGQLSAIDFKEFFNYVEILVNDDDLSKKMGEKGRIKSKQYSWEVVIKQYENLWEELYKKAKHQSNQNRPFLKADIFERFKSYPSKILNGNDEIVTTLSGNSLLDNQANINYYVELNGLINKEVTYSVCRESKNPINIESLVNKLKNQDIDELFINNHISWCLKYGLVELVKL